MSPRCGATERALHARGSLWRHAPPGRQTTDAVDGRSCGPRPVGEVRVTAWETNEAAEGHPFQLAASQAQMTAAKGGATGRSTELHAAAKVGDVVAAYRLLAAGADVRATDSYGATALHRASGGHVPQSRDRRGHAAVIEALLAAGADVHAKDRKGRTALHYASGQYGRVTAVNLLVAAGADVRARNMEGQTALHMASRGGRFAETIVAALAAAGAELHARNMEGDTPRDRARRYGKKAVVNLLARLEEEEH